MHAGTRLHATLLIALTVSPLPVSADALAWVSAQIAKRHDVTQMSVADAKAALQAAPEGWLVLDVREPDEYAVSHLPGAVRVEPGLTAEAFMAQYSDQLDGKDLLLYCSVGQRSSSLADRIAPVMGGNDGRRIVNLEGGIFRWHGEHGPLVNDQGPADVVHPYNRAWGLLRQR